MKEFTQKNSKYTLNGFHVQGNRANRMKTPDNNIDYIPLKYFKELCDLSSNEIEQDDINYGYQDLSKGRAFSMASLILEELKNDKSIKTDVDGILPTSFYEKLSKITNPNKKKSYYDTLTQIHLRQTVILLKKASFIRIEDCSVSTIDTFSESDLAFHLFNSFWNLCDWQLIFPSYPEAALHMKKNKQIIICLLLNAFSNFEVSEIAEHYMNETKFREKNRILFVSFFDFSIITWFSMFGFLEYNTQSSSNCVAASLTKFGKQFLTGLLLSEI